MRAYLVLCLLAAPSAAQQPPDPAKMERARAHFETGHGLYEIGEYEAAAREFAAGYALFPKPDFLINLGQSYRRMGDVVRARRMFQRFIDEMPPGDRRAAEVRRMLQELRAPDPPPPALVPERSAPVAAPALVAPPAVRKSAKPSPRRLAIVLGVTSALVVAGVGIGVGVYFALVPRGPTPIGGILQFQ